jgi:hypothetical protein
LSEYGQLTRSGKENFQIIEQQTPCSDMVFVDYLKEINYLQGWQGVSGLSFA